MPKSKVRKKPMTAAGGQAPANRTPVKISGGPSPIWYKVVMALFGVAGLAWLVVYYIAGDEISFVSSLNAWNFLIGFGLMVIALVMTMWWK
jgi:hypothetical protein